MTMGTQIGSAGAKGTEDGRRTGVAVVGWSDDGFHGWH